MNNSSLREIETALALMWTNPRNVELLQAGKKIAGVPALMQADLNAPLVGIYQDSVWGHRFIYSAGVYPATRKVLATKWVKIVERFWLSRENEDRNQFVVLNDFPNFLRRQVKLMLALPYLADLAEFERDRDIVARNSEQIIKTEFNPAQLMAQQSVLAPIVNQTLILRSYPYQVAEIVKRVLSRGAKNLHCEKRQSTLALYQDPLSNIVKVQQLGEATATLVLTARSEPISYKWLAEATLARLQDRQSAELHKLVFGTFERLHEIGVFSGAEPVFPYNPTEI